MKAIIVDDEKSARDVLETLLTRFCPSVEVINRCTNIVDAVDAIKKQEPDVVFLDIEMPNYAGYEIVSFFEAINFEIVFVTAYDKYAIKAFEISAADYLLKPIEIDRLKLTIEKLSSQLLLKTNNNHLSVLSNTLQSNTVTQLTISEKGYRHIINVGDIVAIEAQEAYSKIYLRNQQSNIVSKNLKHFERLFEENKEFIRTHKSWIVNKTYIETYSNSKLEIVLAHNVLAKLSKYKKSSLKDLL